MHSKSPPSDLIRMVGRSGRSNKSASPAFLWRGGWLMALNFLLPAGYGWAQIGASDVNDARQVVETGLHNDNVRSFLLEPAVFVESLGGSAPALDSALP